MDIPFEKFRDEACKYYKPGTNTRLVCSSSSGSLSFLCNELNCRFAKENKVAESGTKTYIMQYKCYNCGRKFRNKIPVGTLAVGNGGKCPECGVADNKDKAGHEPLQYLIM